MQRLAIGAVLLAACGGDDALVATDGAVADATADASELADPCPATPPACPTPPASLVRGGGMVAIDRCAFPLATDASPTASALIDAYPASLARVTLADVALDLNRAAVKIANSALPGTAPGVRAAWGWQSGDQSVAYWIPQGITGSFDGASSGTVDGRRLVLVSWYYSQEDDPGSTVDKGVRIAIMDVTNPAAVAYRFALLVEPSGTVAAPSFTSVKVHAGGLVWVGDRLYVPVTGSGFRVFDLSRILKVDGLADTIGRDANGTYTAHAYAYAIPQVATYASTGTCAPRFSFSALDLRSTPVSIVTGEYDATSVAGRLYRWPLATDGSLALTDRDRVVPSGAWYAGESHIQGAAAEGKTWWLSSSRPAAGAGELVRTSAEAASTTLGWSDSPEDLALDHIADSMWSLSETVNARYVFEVAAPGLR